MTKRTALAVLFHDGPTKEPPKRVEGVGVAGGGPHRWATDWPETQFAELTSDLDAWEAACDQAEADGDDWPPRPLTHCYVANADADQWERCCGGWQGKQLRQTMGGWGEPKLCPICVDVRAALVDQWYDERAQFAE